MHAFLRSALATVWIQALLGLLTAIASFLAGMLSCELIRGYGQRGLSAFDEWVAATITFCASLALWLLARFRISALFLSAVYIAVFIPALLACLSRSFTWSGFRGMPALYRFTVVPVVCAAIALCVLRSARGRAALLWILPAAVYLPLGVGGFVFTFEGRVPFWVDCLSVVLSSAFVVLNPAIWKLESGWARAVALVAGFVLWSLVLYYFDAWTAFVASCMETAHAPRGL